jgi:cytochrome P450 family 3 subfamily A
VQARLQQEIEECLGEAPPTYDNVAGLQYLDMVLCESMRVYPPIPLHIGRWASRETTICGRTIPQVGTVWNGFAS